MDIRKFKVGDRVRVVRTGGAVRSMAPIGTLATVKAPEYGMSDSTIVIEAYKPFKEGWNCNGLTAKGRGQYVDSTIIRFASIADILGIEP